jgi:hypothetical protein
MDFVRFSEYVALKATEVPHYRSFTFMLYNLTFHLCETCIMSRR